MQMITMKQVCVLLFLLNALFNVTSSSYDIEYVEPECKEDKSTVVFHLGVSGSSTSFIIKPKRSNGYGSKKDCNITISAGNIMKGHVLLTVRRIDFEDPRLCRNYLQIFDGTTNGKKLCGNFNYGVVFTTPKANFMKFQYHTDMSSFSHSGFEIIATAYTDGPCRGTFNFRCNNHNCISSSLTCDGYNNCGDDSDETKDSPARCRLGAGAVAGIVIGVLLLIALVSGIIWCFQRKRRVIKTVYQTPAPTVNPSVQQSYQQSPGGMQNPTYGIPPSQLPPPYKE